MLKDYLNRSFETIQFLASRLRFWKLSVLFSCLKLFAENPNWMQVLQQSYLFFSEGRKWIFYETKLRKTPKFGIRSGNYLVLHKLNFMCLSSYW